MNPAYEGELRAEAEAQLQHVTATNGGVTFLARGVLRLLGELQRIRLNAVTERPPALAIDARGFVWRVYEDHWSMAPSDPSNDPIPEPVTYYRPDGRCWCGDDHHLVSAPRNEGAPL